MSTKFSMTRGTTFSFRGKKVKCDGPVRIGFCEVCEKQFGLKRTFLHHFWYDPLDKLRFTIEVCFKCHLDLDDNLKPNKLIRCFDDA